MSGLSLFKRYLAIQAMTLVCGIVGPIFLFVYFAAQPDATIKWMYWAGLFVTTADVLIALAITSASAKAERVPLDTKAVLALEKLRGRMSNDD
ncbi:hypothetical protein AB4Z39_12045 [Mycobacterium adipatum]|jgi:hypothetical protein|uniref:hypothetical protein n=1 Tax=Mycobacterium adipatum TaxID=1682113 RepID=UPI0034E07C2D